MFGRMMNNYYYGKSGKGDFRKDDMPETRMQLFWDTLRTRLSGLFRLNLLYMLIWLPAMIVIAVNFMNALNTVLADEKILEGISSINIQGHTDSDGTYEHNVEVSEKRAEAVRTECMESIKGDAAAAEKFDKLFKTTGCACDFPILDENNVEDKALSRRVVFVFFMK
jgi:hypothetical protein